MKKRMTRRCDTSESLAVLKEYRGKSRACEVSPFLRSVGIPIVGWLADMDVHHLCEAAGRVNVPSNLLIVSRAAHEWIHANPVDGRIVCAIVKNAKGELDVASYDQLFGQSIIAWLDSDKVKSLIDERLEPHRRKLLVSLNRG